MPYNYAYDGPPTKCHGGPRPGAVALQEGTQALWPAVGTDGIYNCRPVRVAGSTTLSFHADGRAWDAHCSGNLNHQLALWFVSAADTLGIQEVISQSRRWTSQDQQWHDYHGDDPHNEHVHVALCLAAAEHLTKQDVLAVGHQQEDDDVTPQDKKDIIDAVAAHVDARVNTAANDLATTLGRRLDAIEATLAKKP